MLQFLHPSESDPAIPPGFFRVVINDTGNNGPISMIIVDGSWHKITRNAGMACVWEDYQSMNGNVLVTILPDSWVFDHMLLEDDSMSVEIQWTIQDINRVCKKFS